jgi:hypothetical protein
MYNRTNREFSQTMHSVLIAHFLLARHGQHRKQLQQFLVAAGTCLLRLCLGKIGGYADGCTDSPLIRH